MFLNNGGDINAENNGTLLIFAAAGCRLSMVEALLDAGAMPNLQDRWGYTALHR